MTVRFEVCVNGQPVCVSGLNGDGVLSTIVSCIRHADSTPELDLRVGGLGKYNPASERPQHANWNAPSLSVGDEVTIRVLPAGEFDDPVEMSQSPKKTIEDEDFGRLDYYISAWDGEIDFDVPPIAKAHLHLRADEDGPSEIQRRTVLTLIERYRELWPEISSALIRCQPDIEQLEELNNRMAPLLGIEMDDDADQVALTYRIRVDDEYRAYFVTLRDWTVTEFSAAD